MLVTLLLTFNASARACGQKRWQTMWNLRTYKAICHTNIKPKYPPPKMCQNTLPRPTFHLVSIPISMTLLERRTGPTPETCHPALKSHKSGTPLVHHLIPFYFTVSRPLATDPRAKHQALAPSSPMRFRDKSTFVTVLLTCNASARACGQKRWQTMSNLRT